MKDIRDFFWWDTLLGFLVFCATAGFTLFWMGVLARLAYYAFMIGWELI